MSANNNTDRYALYCTLLVSEILAGRPEFLNTAGQPDRSDKKKKQVDAVVVVVVFSLLLRERGLNRLIRYYCSPGSVLLVPDLRWRRFVVGDGRKIAVFTTGNKRTKLPGDGLP